MNQKAFMITYILSLSLVVFCDVIDSPIVIDVDNIYSHDIIQVLLFH
jgi:hypothetical protein